MKRSKKSDTFIIHIWHCSNFIASAKQISPTKITSHSMITRRRRKTIVITKYKPGDIVIVRKDLTTERHYFMEGTSAWNRATNEMVGLSGCAVTINGIVFGQYITSECACRWTDEMFEGKAEDILSDIPSFYDYIGGGENA